MRLQLSEIYVLNFGLVCVTSPSLEKFKSRLRSWHSFFSNVRPTRWNILEYNRDLRPLAGRWLRLRSANRVGTRKKQFFVQKKFTSFQILFQAFLCFTSSLTHRFSSSVHTTLPNHFYISPTSHPLPRFLLTPPLQSSFCPLSLPTVLLNNHPEFSAESGQASPR